jgi:hypothetical protein
VDVGAERHADLVGSKVNATVAKMMMGTAALMYARESPLNVGRKMMPQMTGLIQIFAVQRNAMFAILILLIHA